MPEKAKSKRGRGRLKSIRLNEVSLVDRPANQHAKITLFKRADEDEGSGGAKKNYGGDYSEAAVQVVQEVEALDFDDVLAEERSTEAACRIGDALWNKWHALQRSFRTIAADESVEASAKVTAMQESLQQFIASLSEENEEIADVMTKAISAVPVLAGLLDEEGDSPMTPTEKKQLDELQKTVGELTKKLEAATSDDTAKKAADLQGELDAKKAEIAELTEKAEKAEADAIEATAKAGMSDDEKKYFGGLSDADKAAFMRMSPADRKKQMKKSEDDDPVVYKSEATGEEFRKSDDARLVAMAKRVDESEAVRKETEEARETAELNKRVTEAPYSHYSGEDVDKVEVVRAISKMDEGPRKALETMLETGGKAIAAAFESIGTSKGALPPISDDVKKAQADFGGYVSKIMERDKVSKTDAMSRARKEYPDAFKAAYPPHEDASAN